VIEAHLLLAIVLIPLTGALVVALFGRLAPRLRRPVAAVVALTPCVPALLVLRHYDPAGLTWQFAERARWLPAIGASYAVGVDGFSILLILLTTVVATLAIAVDFSRASPPALPSTMLVLEAGMLMLLVSLDLLMFLLAWTMLIGAAAAVLKADSVTPAGLVRFGVHAGGATIALAAGVLGLSFYAQSHTGTLTFDLQQLLLLSIPSGVQYRLFAAFFVAFAVLLPLVPFGSWVPAVGAGASSGVMILVTGLLVQAGAYGLVRIALPLFPEAARTSARVVTALAILTIAYEAIAGLRQTDWKRAVLHASAAWLALVVLTMFRLTPTTLSAAILLQVDRVLTIGVAILVLAYGSRRPQVATEATTGGRARRTCAYLTAAAVVLLAAAVVSARLPARGPSARLIETSVGRVIARVDPAYAPLVRQPSDCGAPAASVEPSSTAPGGWVTVAPCDEPAAAGPKPDRK
jgi:NADH-quinone oxidoreductase subunit M